jgi:hypothetical protein
MGEHRVPCLPDEVQDHRICLQNHRYAEVCKGTIACEAVMDRFKCLGRIAVDRAAKEW